MLLVPAREGDGRRYGGQSERERGTQNSQVETVG